MSTTVVLSRDACVTTAAFCSASAFDVALDRLAEAAHELGFDAVDYGFMMRARRPDGRYSAPDIVARNFPPRWDMGWARYSSEDPFLGVAYLRTLPLDWREVMRADWLTVIQAEAVAYIRQLGFRDGLSVPIHLPNDGFAFVSGLSRSNEGAWRSREAESSERLFLLAHAFHASAGAHWGRSRAAGDTDSLSPREREVLCLAASGHSAPASARRLQRSVETVRRQRKSAMEKLGAHTISQAVALAMRLGQVPLSPE